MTGFSADALLAMLPAGQSAVGWLLVLFTVKGLTVVVPLDLLYLTAGLLLPPGQAVLVNFLGLVCAFTLPYLLGRFFGPKGLARMQKKYPALERFTRWQQDRPVFVSFLLRQCGVLPGDLVSLYLGFCALPYPKYLAGSLLGSAIALLSATILGSQLREPFSPAFWGALAVRISVSLLSILFEHWLNGRSVRR